MSMRTQLSKVRGLGSAKGGTLHFWQQRLTALALVPLVIFFTGLVVVLAGADYATAKEIMASPIVVILFGLFVIAGVMHMRLGMHVVIEDYVHSEGLKVLAIAGNTLVSCAIGFACLFAVLKLGFGA